MVQRRELILANMVEVMTNIADFWHAERQPLAPSALITAGPEPICEKVQRLVRELGEAD